ncbi:MAG: Eco57I restriction-modification methylase domain-containing protein [Gemmataceae bacterium]|nr:Eco57I restriction-modification methylase domain-containing protein [Gemmataceae bacterium]
MVKDEILKADLTQFAAEQQRRFEAATLPRERKERGHFGTPPAVAEFMSGMITGIPQGAVRVLDPGAGVGTLSAALCQRVLRLKAPRHLDIELWEADPKLVSHLRRTMDHCRTVLRACGHRLDYSVCIDDFILANADRPLFGPTQSFDLAILNPPYFKLRKESAHAKAMKHIVHGQPNVYALFMAVSADLLAAHGKMIAITPRSYFNGPYFQRFRKWFFDRLVARQIHVFESRTETFRNDAVLQENVILLAEKGGEPGEVVLTSSAGRTFEHVGRCAAPYGQVIDDSNGDHVVRVTTSELEHKIIRAIDKLPTRFRDLSFEISTGPVVTFRSTEFLRKERANNTAPLLWMHNVRPFVTQFPSKNGKPTHIVVNDQSKQLLVPAKRYVLLKRFTAKEEKRRLVAGIVEPKDSYSEWLGLENHLNYVYRRGSELTYKEALGLATFFNSVLVDRYFRAISGNTQVNATEIRSMPFPDESTLVRIGEDMERAVFRDASTIDQVVGRALRLPHDLIKMLCEAAK